MNRGPCFAALRASILAALGLAMVGCAGGKGCAGIGKPAGRACENPTAILQTNGSDSGFVQCADGSIDRVKPVTCGVSVKDTCVGIESDRDCTKGSDCKDGTHASCLQSSRPPDPGLTCYCQYQCATDADCGPGAICACAGVGTLSVSTCIPAKQCTTNDGCGSGECGFAEYYNGCYFPRAMVCRTSADACRAGGDCTSGQCGQAGDDAALSCQAKNCTVGRPLIADGAVVTAPGVRRGDWVEEGLSPEADSLEPRVRVALGAYFEAMGAMEHASVGSFARFSLELLAIGAPPGLLQATHEAAGDEIRHARMAYALATAYSGVPVGPGRLPIGRVVPASDEREIVRALVCEACVGETIAAAEALALSTMVEDPVLVSVYGRIAEDEGRHAALGWRCLAWMLERNPELAGEAEEAFARATGGLSSEPLVASDIVSPEHGLLSAASLGALRSKAVAEIVEPCRRAMSRNRFAATSDNFSSLRA